MNIETLLHQEIVTEFDELQELEVGTEEHKTAVDDLTKLVDRAIEMERVELETKNKGDEQKDRLFRNCMAVAGVVVPAAITIWGTLKSFEFEKEGTITTIMGRGFINKLLPKK